MLSIVGKKIKNILIKKNISQKQLSELTNIKQQIISDWINGRRNPKADSLKKLSNALKEPLSYFTDDDYIDPQTVIPLNSDVTIKLPILSTVQCGKPDFCEMDEKVIEDFIEVPKTLFPDGNFVVRCQGESMIPEIPQHAFCIIKKMDTPLHNKNMLIKTQNGFTIKRVKIIKDKVDFYYLNPAEKKLEVSGEIKIIGKVIGSYLKY